LDAIVLLDGEEVDIHGFDIDGDGFFDIIDIGAILGFRVMFRLEENIYRMHIDTFEDPPPEVIEESPAPVVVVVPESPPEPVESEPSVVDELFDDETTQPVPLSIVFGVVAGLCVIGFIVTLLRRRLLKR